MTNLRNISHYLGMQVNHVVGKKITLCQSTYLVKVFNRFKMTKYKPAFIPIDLRVANFLLLYNGNADKETIKQYQLAIRSLIWLAVYICPEIAYSVGVLNCYCSNPGLIYCNLIIQIFRYLSGTFDLEITFTANSEDDLVDYTDLNYTGLIDDRKSTGNYIFMLFGGLLSHQSKFQSTITLLLTKAKYMTTTEAKKEALWIAQFLACLGFCLQSTCQPTCG